MLFSHRIVRNDHFSNGINDRLTLRLRHNFPIQTVDTSEKKDVHETGRQIIADATARAEQILAQAQKEAEEKASELKEKAIREGQEQGYQDGLKKAEAEATRIRDQARDVLRQAEEQRSKTFDSLERDIVTLSVEIAEKILYRQLSMDSDTIMAITEETLKLVKDRHNITIFHNPADRDALEQHRRELQRLLPEHTALKLIADEKISPGGCIVETEHGKVEATIESRWQAVLESLGIGEDPKCL